MIAQFVYLFKSLQPLYAYLFSDSSAYMIAHKHALHTTVLIPTILLELFSFHY